MSGGKVYVPDRCRVGFQAREGTFTNVLAYVIYYDAKKKLRKETSWKGWCHKPTRRCLLSGLHGTPAGDPNGTYDASSYYGGRQGLEFYQKIARSGPVETLEHQRPRYRFSHFDADLPGWKGERWWLWDGDELFLAASVETDDAKHPGEVDWMAYTPASFEGEPKVEVDASLEPRDFQNEPTAGFVLNKGIRRYGWSHFSSGRSMIRVYDPRGWEFEITPANLVHILMHVDCSSRELQGELVYSWSGTELVLLPCEGTDYQDAKNFSRLQGKKVGARDLIKGATYLTRQEDPLIYLGRHPWFEEKSDSESDYAARRRVGKKMHIFCDPNGDANPVRSVPAKIAAVDTEHSHAQYAKWLEDYLNSYRAAALTGWREEPVSDPLEEGKVDCFWKSGDTFFKGTWYEPEAAATNWHLRERRTFGHGSRYDSSDGPLFVADTRIHQDGSWSYCSGGFYSGGGDWHRGVAREEVFQLLALYENGAERVWQREWRY